MRNLIDVWYDLLYEEAINGNIIKIDKETNPLLYKFSVIIDTASHYRDGCMTEEDEEIFNQYLAQEQIPITLKGENDGKE